jgi:hypothetical protein
MSVQQLEISFDDCSPAEAATLAQDLETQLREVDHSTKLSLKKARADSQDFGTTLVVLFGTPVAIALAKAIAIFLQRHSGASITISADGTVVGKNLDSKDAARIAEAFAGRGRA